MWKGNEEKGEREKRPNAKDVGASSFDKYQLGNRL